MQYQVMKVDSDSLNERKCNLIEENYADVSGIKLHYGFSGKGSLILFLHCFPEYWATWKEQLNEFAKDHLAVAPDMRGYNLSSKPQDVSQYKLEILTEEIRQLAEYLGHKRFILVAHDWGGVVAWSFVSDPCYMGRRRYCFTDRMH